MSEEHPPRDTTVRGLLQKLTELVEVNPEWAAFQVVLDDENGRNGYWNGKTFAYTDREEFELEIFE